VIALGRFGHPQDFDFLLAGLKSKDPEELLAFAFTLYEYGDCRAVPNLILLLQTEHKKVGHEVIACLDRLLTPEGIEALQRCAEQTKDNERGQICKNKLSWIFPELKMNYEKYTVQSPPEKARMAALLRDRGEEKYRLKPGDRKATRDDLLKATAEWIGRNRITEGKYAWMEERHILAVATGADIPLFLDVAASVYPRFSDECLSEIQTLNDLIQRLGRSRYRSEAGVCDKVEPLQVLRK
ncbi:MAG: HEAT repeat domain-containing protein, partial [Deltaproteobacteria bacterium]|nr:HEAT repeat domain-containing protein [Deltaproteobacteria bacterium]